MIKITFSWDDGAYEDLKLMDLSLKYDMPGIFFIPAVNQERPVMRRTDIKTLANNNFEIGAHTYSHSYLTLLPQKEAEEEILKGKHFLQELLSQEIPHFCFPGGKSNSNLINYSKQHFSSARTADTGALLNHQSFLIKPTFHFYNRGRKSLIYNSFKNSITLCKSTIKQVTNDDYFSLIQSIIIDLANSENLNNIIIWGHSWEIEEFDYWDKLEELFMFINEHYPSEKISYSNLLNSLKHS